MPDESKRSRFPGVAAAARAYCTALASDDDAAILEAEFAIMRAVKAEHDWDDAEGERIRTQHEADDR